MKDEGLSFKRIGGRDSLFGFQSQVKFSLLEEAQCVCVISSPPFLFFWLWNRWSNCDWIDLQADVGIKSQPRGYIESLESHHLSSCFTWSWVSWNLLQNSPLSVCWVRCKTDVKRKRLRGGGPKKTKKLFWIQMPYPMRFKNLQELPSRREGEIFIRSPHLTFNHTRRTVVLRLLKMNFWGFSLLANLHIFRPSRL